MNRSKKPNKKKDLTPAQLAWLRFFNNLVRDIDKSYPEGFSSKDVDAMFRSKYFKRLVSLGEKGVDIRRLSNLVTYFFYRVENNINVAKYVRPIYEPLTEFHFKEVSNKFKSKKKEYQKQRRVLKNAVKLLIDTPFIPDGFQDNLPERLLKAQHKIGDEYFFEEIWAVEKAKETLSKWLEEWYLPFLQHKYLSDYLPSKNTTLTSLKLEKKGRLFTSRSPYWGELIKAIYIELQKAGITKQDTYQQITELMKFAFPSYFPSLTWKAVKRRINYNSR